MNKELSFPFIEGAIQKGCICIFINIEVSLQIFDICVYMCISQALTWLDWRLWF